MKNNETETETEIQYFKICCSPTPKIAEFKAKKKSQQAKLPWYFF